MHNVLCTLFCTIFDYWFLCVALISILRQCRSVDRLRPSLLYKIVLLNIVVVKVNSLLIQFYRHIPLRGYGCQSTSLPFLFPEDLPFFPSWRPFGLVDSIFGPIQFDSQRYVTWGSVFDRMKCCNRNLVTINK